MESGQTQRSFSALNRRDFLKVLSVTGGAVLLAGCSPQSLDLTTAAVESHLPPSSTPEQELHETVTSIPSPTDTPSLTPLPPSEYLPAMDSSASEYALGLPELLNDKLLGQALKDRHSSRSFRTDELPISMISSILWAGFGINRPDGKRTAPSAYNVQDIDIYLATGKGLYLYKASGHSLVPILPDDLRPFTGTQGFAAIAPLDLVYVSDHSKMGTSDEERQQWSWAHSGCIAQNVYLACSALGLATVLRSTLDRQELGRRMGLNGNQHITLAQTLGHAAQPG